MRDKLSETAPYDAAWFANQAPGSRQSAAVVLPSALDLLESCGWPVRSMVDVGAGAGTWLAVAQELGVGDEILAVEGEWVRDVETEVPKTRYIFADVGRTIKVPRRFDLAISLEVAEHLPAEQATCFVDNITALSDVVLFSAALPHQGGTHHVNEQWPAYWADLFDRRGFVAYDVLRWRLWDDVRVSFWYRQNLLLFVRRSREDLCRALDQLPWRSVFPNGPLAVVHPEKYEGLIAVYRCPPARLLLRALPEALWRAFAWRARRLLGLREGDAE